MQWEEDSYGFCCNSKAKRFPVFRKKTRGTLPSEIVKQGMVVKDCEHK